MGTRRRVDMFAATSAARGGTLPVRPLARKTARRASTPTRALFGKKPAEAAAGEPYYVDGKLWVCQGCGYVYDGSKGAWAEGKRCPMCGERRFALKTPQEMQVAIYSLVAAVVLVASLFLIVKI